MECPKCGEQLMVAAVVPEEQSLVISMTSESEMFDAEGVADTLKATARSMRAIAKELDSRVAVFLKDIRVTPGRIDIEVKIVEKSKAPENC